MKWGDYTPLCAMIVVMACLIAIVVLLVSHDTVPTNIYTALGISVAYLFGMSGQRNPPPPPSGGLKP